MDARTDASRRSDHGDDTEPERSALLQSLLDAADGQDTHQLLEELEQLLHHAPVVHVTTGALPGHDLRLHLTGWFRREIHEHVLLTFAARRDIGGGVVVRAGSHVYDFSFKRLILDNKHRITELAFATPPGAAEPAPTEAADVR